MQTFEAYVNTRDVKIDEGIIGRTIGNVLGWAATALAGSWVGGEVVNMTGAQQLAGVSPDAASGPFAALGGIIGYLSGLPQQAGSLLDALEDKIYSLFKKKKKGDQEAEKYANMISQDPTVAKYFEYLDKLKQRFGKKSDSLKFLTSLDHTSITEKEKESIKHNFTTVLLDKGWYDQPRVLDELLHIFSTIIDCLQKMDPNEQSKDLQSIKLYMKLLKQTIETINSHKKIKEREAEFHRMKVQRSRPSYYLPDESLQDEPLSPEEEEFLDSIKQKLIAGANLAKLPKQIGGEEHEIDPIIERLLAKIGEKPAFINELRRIANAEGFKGKNPEIALVELLITQYPEMAEDLRRILLNKKKLSKDDKKTLRNIRRRPSGSSPTTGTQDPGIQGKVTEESFNYIQNPFHSKLF